MNIHNSIKYSIIPAWIMFLSVGLSKSVVSSAEPDCFGKFPGTPEWDACFQTFDSDLLSIGGKLQHLAKTAKQQAEAERAKIVGVAPGQYHESSSFYNTHSASNTNSVVGGYTVKAMNMLVSTGMVNGVVKINIRLDPADKIQSQVEGNQIKFATFSRGQNKLVEILVPRGIKLEDVKIDHRADAIDITGPTRSGGFQWSGSDTSSSSSSSSSSSNFNQNYGQAFPMPDFQSGFKNMFQNMFQGFLGPQLASSQ